MSISGVSNTNPTGGREYVTPEVLNRYNNIMQRIAGALRNNDGTQLRNAMRDLQAFSNSELDSTLSQGRSQMLAFFTAAGLPPVPQPPLPVLTPSQIDRLKDIALNDRLSPRGPRINMLEATNISRFAGASTTVAELLASFVRQGILQQNAKLEDLYEALGVSKSAIDNLKGLQDIFNLVTVKMPDNFKIPPAELLPGQTIKDIPQEVLNRLKNASPPFPGNGNPPWVQRPPESGNWRPNDEVGWINNTVRGAQPPLIRAFTQVANLYFRETLGVTPNPEYPKTYVDLLTMRDNLRKVLADLIAATDPKDLPPKVGSPARAIQDILNSAPMKAFDHLSLPPPSPIPEDIKRLVIGFINSGIGETNSPMLNLLTTAMNASQNLSDSQKDSLKEAMYVFQQMMELSGKLLDAQKNIGTKFAQNIAR